MTVARAEWSPMGRQWDAGDCGTGCSQASLFQRGHKLDVAVARSMCSWLAQSFRKLSSIFSSNSCLDEEWRDRFFFFHTASILPMLWCWEMLTLVVFLTCFLLHLKNPSIPNVSSLLSEFQSCSWCRWEISGVRVYHQGITTALQLLKLLALETFT